MNNFQNKCIIKAAFAALIFLSACRTNQKAYYKFEGATMGTTYHITYEGTKPKTMKINVDELLIKINQSLSTYDPNSTLSKINNNTSSSSDPYFDEVFNESKVIYKLTNGAFDPTVGPLVNAWGFGFKTSKTVDSAIIDSLMQYVGFDKVTLLNGHIEKQFPEIIIDFSAIAKGYGIDKVAQFFDEKGIENYMIEIGGEVVVKGKSRENDYWTLGINSPIENTNDLFAVALLSNKALATSGNYRNFKIVNGQRYVHTINPKTGYGEISKLLSASVVAQNCMRADALATACMVLGVEKAVELSKKSNDFGLYLIYLNAENKMDAIKSKGYEDVFKIAL